MQAALGPKNRAAPPASAQNGFFEQSAESVSDAVGARGYKGHGLTNQIIY